MSRPLLLRPKISANGTIFHWTNAAKALTAIKRNKLAARRWEHFIESEDRMIAGTSWSQDPRRWQHVNPGYTVCFTANSAAIPNKQFPINGDRVYHQTMFLRGLRSEEQYKVYAPEKISEIFIEGTILNLLNAVSEIKMTEYDDEIACHLQEMGTFEATDRSERVWLRN